MANHSRGQRAQTARPEPVPVPPPQTSGPSRCPEPEMRRWPHPVDERRQELPDFRAALHYIHCALSYQNQLLAEIKTLLEALCLDGEMRQSGK